MPTRTATPKAGASARVRPDELHTYHRNARKGDVASIAASLRVNSQYRPICVNIGTHTGRPAEVLAGNHTLMAVRELAQSHPDDPRWNGIDVFWVDVDDDRARAIVLADNRTAELGGIDADILFELVSAMPDLDGTGFTADDLAELERLATPPSTDDPAWGGALDGLPTGDPSHVTRTFTLTAEQAAVVDEAIEYGKEHIDTGPGQNGGALAWLCTQALPE